jgi:hypothetical protein
MRDGAQPFLLAGAAMSAAAALVHLGCIAFGAPWYRALGAGEQIARMAEAGHWYPTVVTLFIAAVLSGWSAYALSGAGLIRRLPLLRAALCAITAVYLLRGLAFPLLMPHFPGNGPVFWAVSSGICLLIGLVHLVGTWQAWPRLARVIAR